MKRDNCVGGRRPRRNLLAAYFWKKARHERARARASVWLLANIVASWCLIRFFLFPGVVQVLCREAEGASRQSPGENRQVIVYRLHILIPPLFVSSPPFFLRFCGRSVKVLCSNHWVLHCQQSLWCWRWVCTDVFMLINDVGNLLWTCLCLYELYWFWIIAIKC